MKRYDLHVHTDYSPCSTNRIAKILRQAKEKGLSGIAVTDHNTIKGAIELKKLNKDENFDIIIGEEIETEIGHLSGDSDVVSDGTTYIRLGIVQQT